MENFQIKMVQIFQPCNGQENIKNARSDRMSFFLFWNVGSVTAV